LDSVANGVPIWAWAVMLAVVTGMFGLVVALFQRQFSGTDKILEGLAKKIDGLKDEIQKTQLHIANYYVSKEDCQSRHKIM